MSRTLKNLFVMLLALLCTLALAACGGNSTPASTPEPDPTVEPTPTMDPTPTVEPTADTYAIDEEEYSALMPYEFVTQAQDVESSGYTIPAKYYMAIDPKMDYCCIIIYADYSIMCQGLAEENNIPLSSIVNTAENTVIESMLNGMGMFTLDDEQKGTMGNMEAQFYPITALQGEPAKGLAGGFLTSEGKSFCAVYAAVEDCYSEDIQNTLFNSINWKGVK